MLFEELLFQTLQRIELLDPWESPDGQCGQAIADFNGGHFGEIAH